MSEYQYYEFLAIDRPLDDLQRAEVRSLSTRATITATSFVNEYQWGDFGGDPRRLMERYYDAHLYLANWGTRRVMLRMPRSLIDLKVAEEYCVDDQVRAWATDEFLVLDLNSEDDSGDWDYDAPASLSAIVGVRTELAGGDLRPLYLAWLAAHGSGTASEYAPTERETDNQPEPPVPPGLASLTAAQRALADFLRIDDDLLSVAAATSPPLDEIASDPDQLTTWVTNLPPAEQSRLLLRLVTGNPVTARMELLRRFHDEHTTSSIHPPRRSVAELLDDARQLRADRERVIAARSTAEQARRGEANALARRRRLDDLAHDQEAAWSQVDALIATRKPADYNTATALLTDLQALAERDGDRNSFTRRITALRRTHARKHTLIERLDHAGI